MEPPWSEAQGGEEPKPLLREALPPLLAQASEPGAFLFSTSSQRGPGLLSYSSPEHPEADGKHPRAQPTQGLWATSLMRTLGVLASFHQTSEGLRGIWK